MLTTIVFLPLIGALITGLFTQTISNRLSQIITSSSLIISSILSWCLFLEVVNSGKTETIELMRFIDVGGFKANWSLFLDPLTAVMLIVVTTVSAIVHVYSIGYMSHDSHIPRFMSYLSLFTFFMLTLVTSNNLLQFFLGWEGVGLCSYLLIGFWYKKPSANAAAMKAFIVNRVGDLAFLLGIFLIYLTFGSIEFASIFENVNFYKYVEVDIIGYSYNAINVICILLFIGAMGKSAQIGLHTWLPDAMEGPTPVSALIHAATMVTAGVFLVARFSPVFEYADMARDIVTYVGATTAIFAATIAITQNDIKKIIAYSTCSQLGYMFFACGVSAYGAGIFHLMTHAFFKALLFLGAGSVIHAVSDEQDIRKMGGLWKKIPLTYVLMFIGSLALAGIYPFAGFYSKDAILEATFANGTSAGMFAYVVGVAAAFLTALYSWRLIIIVFHGKSNLPLDVEKKVHESPWVMLIPLCFLAVGAIFAGKYGFEFGMVDGHGDFWKKSISMLAEPNILIKAHEIDAIYKNIPLIAGGAGIFMAYILYMLMPGVTACIASLCNPIYKFLLNKWYFDEIYNFIFIQPTKCLGYWLWKKVDIKIIDGLGPNGITFIIKKLANQTSKIQSGYLYHYAFAMIIGVVLILTWYVWLLVI